MKTQDWKSAEKPKALVIGHDPRLQKSDTIAAFALFADYYFNDIPNTASERRKYGLAKSTFDQVHYITVGKIQSNQIFITNLCNYALPHAPKNKGVFITQERAEEGVENIKGILLKNPSIEFVFPMSLQVNYWLQKLNFYRSDNGFLSLSEPLSIGINNEMPYYQPKKSNTFKLICGEVFPLNETSIKIVPILHPKNFPLKGKFLDAYGSAYEKLRIYFSSAQN